MLKQCLSKGLFMSVQWILIIKVILNIVCFKKLKLIIKSICTSNQELVKKQFLYTYINLVEDGLFIHVMN